MQLPHHMTYGSRKLDPRSVLRRCELAAVQYFICFVHVPLCERRGSGTVGQLPPCSMEVLET